ncbi:response regulator [Bacteriovorax sp. Seq25_V]|uniref:response regulator n=1 Tax=Bacteriovorax sp. Seq25_V TaxID=1201288 RepID=UPI000389EA53|nr:response regulator [Bacteriovorax sp. Seq25_V]EQC43404.1 response regulator receiver domain protein [Bacteriovorax sp. Seq25_V]
MTVENINKAKRSDLVRILVVDDSDLSRRTIVSILETHGFNVVGESSSAENAMQQAFNTKANVFLLDVVMPEISGIELANHIRDNIKEPKIIMMSTLDMESVVIESISNGAVDYLSKPFTEQDLIKSVEKIEADIIKENS